jgi:hypothetical protein
MPFEIETAVAAIWFGAIDASFRAVAGQPLSEGIVCPEVDEPPALHRPACDHELEW